MRHTEKMRKCVQGKQHGNAFCECACCESSQGPHHDPYLVRQQSGEPSFVFCGIPKNAISAWKAFLTRAASVGEHEGYDTVCCLRHVEEQRLLNGSRPDVRRVAKELCERQPAHRTLATSHRTLADVALADRAIAVGALAASVGRNALASKLGVVPQPPLADALLC